MRSVQINVPRFDIQSLTQEEFLDIKWAVSQMVAKVNDPQGKKDWIALYNNLNQAVKDA